MKIFHYIILGAINKGNICACLCVYEFVCVSTTLYVSKYIYLHVWAKFHPNKNTCSLTHNFYALVVMGKPYL